MNWNRTKTILIFLFLAINIFLYTVLGNLNAEIENIDMEVINNAVLVAKKQNIIIPKEAVMSKRCRNLKMELFGIVSEPEKTAKRFLGSKFTVEEKLDDERIFSFSQDEKKLKINGQQFTYLRGDEYQSVKNEESAKEKALSNLSAFKINKKNVKAFKEGNENGKKYLMIKPFYEGYNVEGAQLKMIYDDKGIYELSGSWFDFSSLKEENEFLDDITSVITTLENKDNKDINIVSVDFSQYIPADAIGGRYVSTIPVYIFEKDDGGRIIIDARTGKAL